MSNVPTFSTQGEFVAITLHENPFTEIFVTVCPHWENNRTAILEFYNGDVKIVEYNDIRWKRDLLPEEK